MSTKTLPLSSSQHQGWDRFCEDRAVTKEREKRFLADCLLELGGRLNEPWQFDESSRQFWIEIPNPPITGEETDAADKRTAAPLDENLAG